MWACEWMNKTCGKTQINTDFISKTMPPEMIRELRQTWLDGGISYETLWTNLQQGEVADQHKTFDQEQSDIESSEPPGMSGADDTFDVDDEN